MVKRCAASLWKRETGVLCPDLLAGWSEEQRELFNNDWNHDSFLDGLKDFPDCQTPEPTIPDKVCNHLQTGKGSRKRPVESSTESTPRKRSKTAPLFTIKLVKQVRVKMFKTKGLDYRLQFGDLQVQGLPDVLRQLHRVFESLLYGTP